MTSSPLMQPTPLKVMWSKLICSICIICLLFRLRCLKNGIHSLIILTARLFKILFFKITNKMRFGFLILFFVFSAQLFAQKFPMFENYKWEKDPERSVVNASNSLYYYSKYMLAIEYEFDDYYGRYFK